MQKTFLGLMFSFAISGPVHTYPYIFENEEFFLCFRNIQYPSARSVFESLSPVQT